MKRARAALFALAFLLLAAGAGGAAPAVPAAPQEAVVYASSACGHCTPYLNALEALLKEHGFRVARRDLLNDPGARAAWSALHDKRGVPASLRGHLTADLGPLLLEGHVPLSLVRSLLSAPGPLPELVVFQDAMVEEAHVPGYTVYRDRRASACQPRESVEACLARASARAPPAQDAPLLWLVVPAGLLAGLHPCTLGVLFLFLALLFTLGKGRALTLRVGAGYIAGVFVAYTFIGLALLQAASFAEPHLAARASGLLVAALGLYNVARYFFPSLKGPSLPAPVKAWAAEKAASLQFSAAFAVGLVVGACSFGCTTGIYIAVLGLLLSRPAEGLFYLLLYNALFVLPLVLVLALVTRPALLARAQKLSASRARLLRLAGGLFMMALGWLLFSGVLG